MQGVLAPLQFVVFLVSLGLVVRFLVTGDGEEIADGVGRRQDARALHDHDHRLDLGEGGLRRYLFAAAFFWEDVFSMLVLALHTAYLAALFLGLLGPRALMLLALAAYAAYVINADPVRAEAARGAAAQRAGGRLSRRRARNRSPRHERARAPST